MKNEFFETIPSYRSVSRFMGRVFDIQDEEEGHHIHKPIEQIRPLEVTPSRLKTAQNIRISIIFL